MAIADTPRTASVPPAEVTVVHLVATRRFVGYPLGAASVWAAFRSAGIQAELRDTLLGKDDLLEIGSLARTLEGAGDLVWICCGPEVLPLLALALPEVRRSQPNARIVVGERVPLLPKQAGPTDVAEELLRLIPELDAVAVGESDLTAAEVGRSHLRLDGIPGLFWRANGHVRHAPPRQRADPIPEWPLGDVSADHVRHYQELFGDNEAHYHPVSASRGCSYQCAFCSASPAWGGRQVRRPVEAVLGEIATIVERTGHRRFTINDETFVLNRRWTESFCAELHRKDLEIRWRCTGRVDLVDAELLDVMARAGCESMELGIESGSDAVLQRIGKGFDTATALKVVRRSGAAIPEVTCNFIWGFPFETTTEVAETVLLMEAMNRMDTVGVKLGLLLPVRPSRLWDEYRSAVRFDRLWHHLAPRHPTVEAMLDLVEAHPETFSPFCVFDHPELEAKLRFLERTGLEEEVTANALTAKLR